MAKRRVYCVGCYKIAHEDRDIAHAVLTPEDDRGYYNIIHSDDRPDVPLGAEVSYRVELTDAEAERFRGASNCRYVELDQEASHSPWAGAGATVVPAGSSMAYMRAAFPGAEDFHGRDQPIAILDGGISPAVATYLGATVAAKQIFTAEVVGADGVTADHGCKVAACGVPDGGVVYDAVVSTNAGTTTYSIMASAVQWALDEGVRIINISFNGGTSSAPLEDAMRNAATAGAQVVISAGNANQTSLEYPATLSRTFSNVHSAIAFDEDTDARASFSSHDTTGSGCSPGKQVFGLSPTAVPLLWDGTSAAAPHMARLIAMGCTGGHRTPAQVAAALRANTRNTGQAASEQGAGAWDLHRALRALGLMAAPTTGAGDIEIVATVGSAGQVSGYTVSPGSFNAGDLRILVITAGSTVTMSTPAGWTLLRDHNDGVSLHVWVFARNWTVGEPSVLFDFDTTGTFFASFSAVVLRSASGTLDPNLIVPIMKFAATTQVASTVTNPYRTKDLLVAVFAQRDTAAPSGTLSLPAGLTQRGFFRPSTGTTGHKNLIATRQLTTGDEVGPYASTSNVAGGSVAVLLTVSVAAVAATVLPTYVRDVQTGALASGQVVVQRPAGVVAGDLMLGVLNCNYLGVDGLNDDWEYVVGAASLPANFDSEILVWRRVAGADEPGSYTFTVAGATSATAAVMAFDQQRVGSAWDVVPALEQGSYYTSTTTPASQSLSPTSAQALNLVVYGPPAATSGHASHTAPFGMDELLDYVPAGAGLKRGLLVVGDLVDPGPTGTRTATRNGSATGYLVLPFAIASVPLPTLPIFRENELVTATTLNGVSDVLALLWDIHHGGFRHRRPMAAARVTSGTAANSTPTLLSWGSVDYDTAEFLTVGGQVWTVPDGLGGMYRLNLTTALNTVAGSLSFSSVRGSIEVNGATLVAQAEGAMSATAPSAVACGGLTRLEPGDTIRWYVLHNGGTTATITPGVTRATIRRIGP